MEVPRHWRLNAQRYALAGTICEDCGKAHFPPREVCSTCAHAEYVEQETVGVAEMVAESTARHARNRSRNRRAALRPATHLA